MLDHADLYKAVARELAPCFVACHWFPEEHARCCITAQGFLHLCGWLADKTEDNICQWVYVCFAEQWQVQVAAGGKDCIAECGGRLAVTRSASWAKMRHSVVGCGL